MSGMDEMVGRGAGRAGHHAGARPLHGGDRATSRPRSRRGPGQGRRHWACVPGLNHRRTASKARRHKFAADPSLEGTGFEPSVPPFRSGVPAPIGGSGSSRTLRWREADSNSRSHSKRALRGRKETPKTRSYKFGPRPAAHFNLFCSASHSIEPMAHAGWTGYGFLCASSLAASWR